MHGRRRLLLLVCTFFLGGADLAFARQWLVLEDASGDAPSIQAGIDSASAGDTVLVSSGSYHEAINFRGKGIVVKSQNGPNLTTIDATSLGGDVVTFASGETRSAILQGFEITGGSRGILIFECEPSILDNIITGNTGTEDGAGILCSGSDLEAGPWAPLISANSITSNTAQYLAGGVGAFFAMAPQVLNNEIGGNTATRGDGGGIYCLTYFDGTILRGNNVYDNFAGDHGGGIYVATALPGSPIGLECSWNLVSNNVANGRAATGNSGGGIWMHGTSAAIFNNTIVGNTGNGPSNSYGAGLVLEQPGNPDIERNIIAFNAKGGGLWCGGGVTPNIMNNLAWNNQDGDGVGTCSDWWTGNGNVLADPLFCDLASGNLSVAQNSPVITHSSGPLGALPTPGCGPVNVKNSTWGSLKARYGK